MVVRVLCYSDESLEIVVKKAIAGGIEGGLCRSVFILFARGTVSDEDEQYES